MEAACSTGTGVGEGNVPSRSKVRSSPIVIGHMVSGDSTGLLPSMPNGLTYALLRPLLIPFALVCLGLGFVLWRFMGDIPTVLRMGLEVFADWLLHGGPGPQKRRPDVSIAYPVDAGVDAIRAVDPAFSTPSFLAEVERIGGLVVAGWANRNLADCRSVMTDACSNLQQAQLARVGDGWRPFAQTVTLHAESIVAVRSERATYRINVRMRMQCPPGTGKVTRGRRILEWVEDWTLVRARSGSPDAGWRVDAMNHVAVHLERAA